MKTTTSIKYAEIFQIGVISISSLTVLLSVNQSCFA
jgi:hypothetical protein